MDPVTLAANAASVISQTIFSPFKTTELQIKSSDAERVRAEPVVPGFKVILLLVFVLTVGYAVGQAVMASYWTGEPTALQQQAFDSLGFGWKIGFGAVIGLIGGKAS